MKYITEKDMDEARKFAEDLEKYRVDNQTIYNSADIILTRLTAIQQERKRILESAYKAQASPLKLIEEPDEFWVFIEDLEKIVRRI